MSAADLPRARPGRLIEAIAQCQRPDLRNLVFSVKSFLGCIAALLVSFELDLERPSWAMLTAYIVAQPYAGMVQSKAAYRVAGTLAGGTFSVLALGTLSSARELLIAALALWLAVTVFFTQLDRSARSYSFMLAGFTASIISFPNVDDPGVIFETALARCEEITVGIVCATIANQLLWPQRAGDALIRRLDLWLADAGRWSVDILTCYDAPNAAERRRRDRERLIADALAVEALREHAMFDTPGLRYAQSWVLELQRRMQGLLAVLVSIEDRIEILRADRSDPLATRHPLLQRTADRIAAGPAAAPAIEPLIAELGSSAPRLSDLATDTPVLVDGTLVARLADLLRYWQACGDLLDRIRRGQRGGDRPAPPRRHADPLTALLAGLGAATAIVLGNIFWIATDWPSGSGAVIQAGVLCAIFAGADNPAALAMRFLTGITIGTALAFVYVLVLLPGIDGLPLLIGALALFYIPAGLLMADPARAALALPILVGFTSLLDLRNAAAVDFATSLNSAIAQILGMALAIILLRSYRGLVFPWAERRLIAAIRRDLALIAAGRLDRSTFESRMFDRLHLLQTRHRPGSATGNEQDQVARGALAALRIGLNLVLLRDAESGLFPAALAAARDARARLARMLRRPADIPEILDVAAAFETGLRALADVPESGPNRQAAMALGGIRLLLLRHRGFFAASGGRSSAPVTGTMPA